jgi:hypothetical protein
MKKKAIGLGVVGCALVAVLCSHAFAFGPNFNAKIALHVKAHGTTCASGFPVVNSCDDMITTYPGLGDMDVIPVYYDVMEYTAVRFALNWPAEWGTMSWVRCRGDAAEGTIQNPDDYTHITWTACQQHWSEAPGYGWVHATSRWCLYPHHATIVDCGHWYGYPVTDYACPAASCVGGWIGDDPCVNLSATEPTTWGAIKALVK